MRHLALALLWACGSAAAQGVDPLALQSAEPAAAAPAADGRFFVEAAIGQNQRRHGLDEQTPTRLSVDFAQRWRLGGGWRAALSNRLDVQDPLPPGASERVLNSLREAYAGWGNEGGDTLLEFGRINLRFGPAYGYNPTDFFRAGALRSPTSVDPIALRENRLGTVMLRGQHIIGSQTFGWALAPKLDSRPDGRSFSLDLGSTNGSDRLLLSWGSRFSERLSTQLIAFHERGQGSQIGLNATALLSDSVVLFGEFTSGRDRDLLTARLRNDQRAAAGLTLALPAKLSLTIEASHNGFGLNEAGVAQARLLGPARFAALLTGSRAQQEQWGRQAWTIYLTQQGGLMRKLDISALLRRNTTDDSQLGWIELRHRWDGFDAALQYQWSRGGSFSEFGFSPVRSQLLALLTVYF